LVDCLTEAQHQKYNKNDIGLRSKCACRMPKIVSTTRGLCQFTTHGINKLLERNITNHVRKIASQSISKRMEFESPKLWIDCDAGVDDAQGLVLALMMPGVEVVGVSAVHGNVGCKQVVKNVARILKLCGSKVPYFQGRDTPLSGSSIPASFWHGKDGLGDVPDTPPAVSKVSICPRPEQASVAICEAARKHRGKLRLVAIGPLTNVAVALEQEPQLPSLLKSLTIMGGCEDGGNVTPTAEFNFHCDPEAAQLVLASFRGVQLVTWDAVLRMGLPWSEYDVWLSDKRSPVADFLEAVGRIGMAHDRKSDAKWLVCDPMVVAVAICAALVESTEAVHCRVETKTSARGQSVFKRGGGMPASANVNLIQSMDMGRMMEMLRCGVRSPSL